MANKLLEIGLFLTKYVTIPILLLALVIWVAIQVNKKLNED